MKLDFDDGDIEFVLDQPVVVQPYQDLKLEDMALVPASQSRLDAWFASETHSNLVRTSAFFSKDFGLTDLSSYDPDSLTDSRLVRASATTGEIFEEAVLPDFVHWNMEYDWDSSMCVGNRPFQGLHALSITNSSDPDYDFVMFAAFQAALYQDGSAPTDFSESATRVLVYGLKALEADDKRNASTAKYLKSFRYDTSRLTLKSYQSSASHFNALFAILAIDETSILVVECENLIGVGKADSKIINRLFYVEFDNDKTVDNCASLLDCDIEASTKYLVWHRNDDKKLHGIAWGPDLEDGRRSLALSYENGDKVGVHFEYFALNEKELELLLPWSPQDTSEKMLEKRTVAVTVTFSLLLILSMIQVFWLKRIESKNEVNNTALDGDCNINEKSSSFSFSQYALVSAMLNSFLVGGLTFGYSGIVLILRKEGVYAQNCSCGSFW